MSVRYRKLPVTIDAVRWTGDNDAEMQAFATGHWRIVDPEDRAEDPDITAEVLDDLHATWVGVKTGQWIIRGLAGEFYPCDPGVFDASYERVSGE